MQCYSAQYSIINIEQIKPVDYVYQVNTLDQIIVTYVVVCLLRQRLNSKMKQHWVMCIIRVKKTF